MKRLYGGLIIMLFVFAVEAFSKPWNGITPSVSTRAEVKKILGKGEPWQRELAYYRFKKFTIYISYKKKGDNYSDEDIVDTISVYPDNRGKSLANYIKKIPNFYKDFIKREVDDKISHVDGLTYYSNDTAGFEIKVQHGQKTGQGLITGFKYYAPFSRKHQEESEESTMF
jgi:hypothetical protein